MATDVPELKHQVGSGVLVRPAGAARGPSFGIWLLAAISLILPWIGIPLALWGVLSIANGWDHGWLLVASGVAMIVLDVCIDFIWAAQLAGRTDEPALNRGGETLVGRMAVVVAAIESGRGRVRIGDSEWIAAGSTGDLGDLVVVVAVDGTVLQVRPAAPQSPSSP
ncbi:MAG: NfeD family protein [Hyphomicrobiaceae bacterium]